MYPGLTEGLRGWKSILGVSHVITDAAQLSLASSGTFTTRGRVLAILRPADRDEVQRCVRVANQCGVPLYPISSGKNWGYGSRVPNEDGVLLDLGRLNRIVAYDEDLAYVTIEPGVTQRQLFAHLQAHGGRLWMDATGASPDCSIIGNTLERGFGHTPMGDHAANACGMEIVLPTGECIETGFGRFSGASTTPLNRWGVGPSLDGLFAQANFGIVTRMTVWLMPKPECFQAFFFKTANPDGMPEIIDALRPLRLDNTLRSVVHIGNDYKVLTASGHGRHDDSGAVRRFDDEGMAQVRALLGIGYWNGSGALYGSKAQVRDARRRLRRALKGKVDRLQFVDDRLLGLMRRFAGPIGLLTRWDLRRTLEVLESIYGLLKGQPTDATLASVYWPKRDQGASRTNPDADGCGLLWCSPVVPNTGNDLASVTRLAAETLTTFGFEPQMSISLATERTAICVVTISYDRAQPGADARALECYRVLTQLLIVAGYPPYRLNVNTSTLFEGQEEYAETLRTVKTALDPNGILAPGRYVKPSPRRAQQEGVA